MFDLAKYILAKALKIVLNPPALKRCDIDKTSKVCVKSELNNVCIGRYSYIGNQCLMVNVNVGNFCSIADNCYIGSENHPITRVSTSPVFHEGKNVLKKNFAYFEKFEAKTTVIKNDVWIGRGTFVKSGITIGNGSIVGMGSVVTKDIPPYEIWAGNPARKIRDRFDNDKKKTLEKIKWWDWSDEMISSNSNLFDKPDDFISVICGEGYNENFNDNFCV